LLSGSKNSHIATLVERHSRFVSVVQSLITQMRMLPERLRKSLTLGQRPGICRTQTV
jgi:hypothetical protein